MLLLAAGVAARLVGGVNPDELIGQDLLFPVVSLSVAIILFEGGLTLQLRELKQAGSMVFRLVTIGVIVSWVLTAVFAKWLFEMDLRIAALLGAVLVVTGPTVIAPLLRHIRPSRQVASIVKWEGIVIDPIGAILAVLTFTLLAAAFEDASLTFAERGLIVASLLGKTVAVGVIVSLVSGCLLIGMMKNYWIPDFLHNACFLSVALCSFTLSNYWQEESGLLTVTLLGILLANQKTVPVQHVVEFKENLRVLLISCLFIVLAARIEISQLLHLGWGGIAFLLSLILIVRPLSVFASSLGTALTWQQRVFLAALAPRGIVAAAVSAIFALHLSTHASPAETEIPDRSVVAADQAAAISAANAESPQKLSDHMIAGADDLVPITFLVIIGTVAFYGLFAAPLARWLGLAVPNPQGVMFAGAPPWARAIAKALCEEQVPVLMVDTNFRNVSEAKMQGIPAQCASILSEYVAEELDLAGIGRMLAVTPNDDLNRLATLEFSHDFGRAEVYQLAESGVHSPRRETTTHLQARTLFADDATYGALSARFSRGQQVKCTTLSDEFTYDAFLQMYGETALVLFLKSEAGELTVVTPDREFDPEPGTRLIAMVDATV